MFPHSTNRHLEPAHHAVAAGDRPPDMAGLLLTGFARSNKSLAESTVTLQQNIEQWTEVANTGWASVKLLSHRLMDNTTLNTQAASAAAQAMAAAVTIPEATRIHLAFTRAQLARSNAQISDFLELSGMVVQHVLEVTCAITGTARASFAPEALGSN